MKDFDDFYSWYVTERMSDDQESATAVFDRYGSDDMTPEREMAIMEMHTLVLVDARLRAYHEWLSSQIG